MELINDLINPSDLFKVNLQFIFLFIEIVTVASFVSISVCYYFFVEKTPIILYITVYLTIVFANQLAFAMFTIRSGPEAVENWTRIMYITEYCSIYVFFLFTMSSRGRKATNLRRINTMLFAVGLMYVLTIQVEPIIIYLYAMFSMAISWIVTFKVYRENKKESALIFKLLNIYILYFIIDLLISYIYGIKYTFDWLVIIITVCSLVIYFLLRYKAIYHEKAALAKKLIRDNLTGLYTKVYLIQQLENKKKGHLLFLDINQFKEVNDRFGHAFGDQILRGIGETLQTLNQGGQIAARVGGDEFMVYSPELKEESITAMAKGIIKAFETMIEDKDIHVEGLGLSIGISKLDQEPLINTYDKSDKAMYDAKKQGNNQIVWDY